MVGFTIGLNFFPRSSSFSNLNGKGKLGRDLQGNVQTLAQERRKNGTAKQKVYQANTGQGKMRIGLDYPDEDGTKVEAIEPTGEIPKESYSHDKNLNLWLQSRETLKNREDRAKVYLIVA